MTDQPRCEPPEGWRERDGWHWLSYREEPMCFGLWESVQDSWWFPDDQTHGRPDGMSRDWRYLAPVTPPAVVRGLVEALDAIVDGDHPEGTSLAVNGNYRELAERFQSLARAALKAAKEAGV